MSKKVADVDADLAQFKADVAADREETRQRWDVIKEAIDRNKADSDIMKEAIDRNKADSDIMKEAIDRNKADSDKQFAEVMLLLKALQPSTTAAAPPLPTSGFATQPMLTSDYAALTPPASFPTAPLINPTASPSVAYTSFSGLRFDSQGFPLPPWETSGQVLAVKDEPLMVLESVVAAAPVAAAAASVVAAAGVPFEQSFVPLGRIKQNTAEHHKMFIWQIILKLGYEICLGHLLTNVRWKQEPVPAQRSVWDPGITQGNIFKQHLEDKVFLGERVLI